MQHPGLAFVLKLIAFAMLGDDEAVVEQAVEHGCGRHDIAKDETPV